MPTMSRVESTFCRSRLWTAFAGHVVLPWALQGFNPHGEVLEIGAGSGGMAAELLARHPDVTMTVTDFDEAMVGTALTRLTAFGDRVTVCQADATALAFPDASFDYVLSWIMLHHTVEWEQALGEAVRVVRPGGSVVGYDLLSTLPLRLVHQAEGAPFRMVRLGELRAVAQNLRVAEAVLTPGLAGFVVRFSLRKPGAEDASRAALRARANPAVASNFRAGCRWRHPSRPST